MLRPSTQTIDSKEDGGPMNRSRRTQIFIPLALCALVTAVTAIGSEAGLVAEEVAAPSVTSPMPIAVTAVTSAQSASGMKLWVRRERFIGPPSSLESIVWVDGRSICRRDQAAVIAM